MNDAQIWAVIGVLAVTLISSLAATTTLFTRLLTSQIGGLRAEMNARFDSVNQRFDSVNQQFDAVNQRFDAVNQRIDGLDRDMNLVYKRLFGSDQAE